MKEFSDQTRTVIRAEYRARGYDSVDESRLRTELGAVAPIRLRPLQIPEAGGSFEIWLAVEFIGASAAAGLLGHVMGRFYDDFARRLKRFFEHKAAK